MQGKVQVTVLVPEQRLAEFYSMVGSWLGASSLSGGRSAPSQEGARAKPQGRPAIASGRYAPLLEYLDQQAKEGHDTLDVSFDEVEDMIDTPLPASARKHRAFWANTEQRAHAKGWMQLGWKVVGVDLDEGKLSFARD